MNRKKFIKQPLHLQYAALMCQMMPHAITEESDHVNIQSEATKLILVFQ